MPALWWRGGGTRATVQHLALGKRDDDWHRAGDAEVRELTEFAAVLMRKDPPFDLEYVYSTYLLEQAEAAGARVFNRPRAIRDNNEKLAIAPFHEFIAPTLVTRDAELVQAFIDEQQDVIVKPLDGMGGTSIFRVRADDANRNVIVETVGALGTRTIMVQRYIPQIAELSTWYGFSEAYLEAERRRGKLASAASFVHAGPKVGRNDPCPCGSGRKFKKCCLH